MSDPKNILITGASRGIGQAIARLAAQQGWSIGLNYNQSQTEAMSLAEELRQMGTKVICLQADVSQQSHVKRMFSEFDEALGPMHALINNAGILASIMITDVDETNVHRLYSANVFSVYYCAREAVLRMSTAHGGSGGAIVNMSSVAGVDSTPGGVGYVASKHAIVGLTKAAALEYAPEKIRINAVAPAVIETEMLTAGIAAQPGLEDSMIVKHPIGRFGQLAEVTRAVLWLCSDEASYITGTTLMVDGGYTAQ